MRPRQLELRLLKFADTLELRLLGLLAKSGIVDDVTGGGLISSRFWPRYGEAMHGACHLPNVHIVVAYSAAAVTTSVVLVAGRGTRIRSLNEVCASGEYVPGCSIWQVNGAGN